MKKITLFIFTFFIAISIYSQNITGSWYGVLKVQGTQLRLVFNITESDYKR